MTLHVLLCFNQGMINGFSAMFIFSVYVLGYDQEYICHVIYVNIYIECLSLGYAKGYLCHVIYVDIECVCFRVC